MPMACELPIDWPTTHEQLSDHIEERALILRVVQVYQAVQIESYPVTNIQAVCEERYCVRVMSFNRFRHLMRATCERGCDVCDMCDDVSVMCLCLCRVRDVRILF